MCVKAFPSFLRQEEGSKVLGFSGCLMSPTLLNNNYLITATKQQQDNDIFVPAQEHAERQVWNGIFQKQVCRMYIMTMMTSE